MLKTFCFYIAAVMACSAFATAGAVNVPEGLWDPSKYIGLDEIEPGMQAYCLTEYGVAGIEKFAMEVVDVVRNVNPSSGPGSRDAILVKGTDERFIHTGPVAGCSGSPVYIDGRLAGALAFTWTYAKDPLYGATPIAEMLAVGRGAESSTAAEGGLAFDYTVPLDYTEMERQFKASPAFTGSAGNRLPCPLTISGLSPEVSRQLGQAVEPFGFVVVAGAGTAASDAGAGGMEKLLPGSYIAVPFVSGDITMSTYGTVTDVVGDKVYAFGHFLLGYGRIDLPLATAKVHTVVSNITSSFKLASVVDTVGAITTDEAAGVIGQLGLRAKTIPLTIRVDRYNDTQQRLYNCRLANNRILSPFYFRMAVVGATLQLGDLPPEHMIEYEFDIGIKNGETVTGGNVSSGMGINELVMECYSAIGLLMNNPYEHPDIESIDVEIRIMPRSVVSHIWSVDFSDSKVKAGESIEINAVIESVLAGKKKYRWTLDIPEDLPPGQYELTVCGYRDYEQFLVKSAPHRFIAQSLASLIKALNNSLQIARDKLYCLLSLPAGGVIIENAELPHLPATKALIMQDTKRPLRVRPYAHWIEKNINTDTVVIDKRVLKITVEK